MGWKDELKKGQKFMRDAYMFANTGKLPDKKSNPNAGKLDLGHLRAEAERNGFNPLTVLRATGGQGSRYSNEPARLSSGDFWKVFNQKTQTETQVPVIQREQQQDKYANFERFIPVKVGNEMKQLDKTVARRLDILPGDTISPGDLEEILGEFHGNVTSAVATEIQKAVISGGVVGGYGSVGSIPELSTENFEQNYKSGAIKTSKIRNKYGAYDLSDDPIFQWTQDFFNDAKRVFKQNHGS